MYVELVSFRRWWASGLCIRAAAFFIYINDIDDNIINKLSKFADDTKLVGNFTAEEQVASMRQDLKELYRWSEDWLIMFNTEKCKVIHFGRDNLISSYELVAVA